MLGEQAVRQLQTGPQHGRKASVEEVFGQRWRKAYEVRSLERVSRQAKDQGGSQQGSIDSPPAAAPDVTAQGPPAMDVSAAEEHPAVRAASQPAACTRAAPVAGSAPSGGGKARRFQEVEDEEDSCIPAVPPASGRAPSSAQAPRPLSAAASTAGGGQLDEEEEEGVECCLVWDSSSRQPGSATRPALEAGDSAAGRLKEQGNSFLRAGNYLEAVAKYTQALEACCQQAAPQASDAGEPEGRSGATAPPPPHQQLAATLHSNRSHAHLKLKQHAKAAADAQHAHQLHPTWTKPLYRLAQAELAMGRWTAAVAACRTGEALAPKNSEGHTEFTPLLDSVAVHAARAGSLAGYDGQQLEVRDAGDEAWLCREAPHVPELDGPLNTDEPGVVTTLALPSSPGGGAAATAQLARGSDALPAWDCRQTAAARAQRRTSFRSVKEAVAAARDGDRILLLRGTHNGMGETVNVAKRLLIEGQGALGDTVIDQRANNPTFRITRGGVVLRNLFLDHSGFHEALMVEGRRATPLVQDCRIKCSGDDAVNTAGAAAPTLLRCVLEAKKVGLKAYGSSAPRLERCTLQQCGEQGLRAMEAAAPVLQACTIGECREEAVVGMDAARVTLLGCLLQDCKGPGVDLSGGAQATIGGGRIQRCVGGVWLWGAARAQLSGAFVAGGPAHAVLADGEARVEVRDSTLKGLVHASDAAWQGILHASNRLQDPDQPADFPMEKGPFRFVPNQFTRKQ